MDKTRQPSVLTGAFAGLLLTAPVVAIFFLADQAAGLPFVPFDLFDFIGQRVLPGGILTQGIDMMVETIIALNLGETSSAAKNIEQLIGLGLFLTAGAVCGALLFFAVPRIKGPVGQGYNPGIILGSAAGIIMLLISLEINVTATADPSIGTVWIIAMFLAWGMALNWVYSRLAAAPLPGEAPPETNVTVIDRRQFVIRLGGATAALTVVGAGLGALLKPRLEPVSVEVAQNTTLTNTGDTLVPAPGTRPEYTPLDQHYRIDISARPPVIDGTAWRLKVEGLVDNPTEFTLDDLRAFPAIDQFVTLACISNRLGGDLTSTTRWTGVSLQTIMDVVQPKANGTHLRITSADGFDEVLDLSLAQEDSRVMLAYDWDGEPLRQKHGFPLRVYIPDRFGMKQPKWITKIEVIDKWEEGYWVRRGWSAEAIMVTTSVIDTVAADSLIQDGDRYLVPIGGIAHAGARGIQKVEVKVDNGAWVEAKLRAPLSETTWVIWRYDWLFAPGTHTFAVRCVDGDGTPQIETVRGVRPDGATGIHTANKNLQDMQA